MLSHASEKKDFIKMKYSNKNTGKEEKDMIPIELPVLDKKIQSIMSQNIECSKVTDIDHGIFNEARNRFKLPLNKVGFVQIIADTRLSMPDSINNLLDGNKKTNWLSTRRLNPQLTLYFPFHLLTINAIGLRSHFEPNFGQFTFLERFVVEAMDDEKNWKAVGFFRTLMLSFLGAKHIFKFKEVGPIRALRLIYEGSINKCYNFGLSMIELFGTAEYNVSPVRCSENTFRDLSNSLLDKQYTERTYSTGGQRQKETLKSQFATKKKFWPKETDSEGFTDLYEFTIIATDQNKPSLVEKYEEILRKPISILQPENIGLISSIEKNTVEPKNCYKFDFNCVEFEIDEIQITTDSDPKSTPKGLIVSAIKLQDKDKAEPYTYIGCSPYMQLEPDTKYLFKFPDNTKYKAIQIFSYDMETFKLKKIDIFGVVYEMPKPDDLYKKKQKRCLKPNYPCLKCFPPPAIETEEDILDPMAYHYGPTLNGYVLITERTNDKSLCTYYHFLDEPLHSSSTDYPAVCFYFYNHQITLSQIQLTITDKKNPVKYFIIEGIKYDDGKMLEHILFDGNLDFSKEDTITIKCETNTIDEINIASDKPFEINHFKFTGKSSIKEFDEYHDKTFLTKQTQIRTKIEEKTKAIKLEERQTKEREKILASLPVLRNEYNNQIILNDYKGKDPIYTAEITFQKHSDVDIMQYGCEHFENFYRFFSIGGDGHSSLFENNKDKVWVSDVANKSIFTIVLNKHALKIKGLIFVLPKDPKYVRYQPTTYCLYGYSATANRWDVILLGDYKKPFSPGETEINIVDSGIECNLYRAFCFYNYTEHLALSCFQLFGSLYEDDKYLDDSLFQRYPKISYDHHPVIEAHIKKGYSTGILRAAMEYYGTKLTNFVQVFAVKENENILDESIWGVLYDRDFKIRKYDNTKVISFYFPNHVVYIEGYTIKPGKDHTLKNWVIVTYLTDKPHYDGLIISQFYNYEKFNENANVRFNVSSLNNSVRPCRIIRFIGLEKQVALKYLDFFGYAVPSEHIPPPKDELQISYPMEIYYKYVSINKTDVSNNESSSDDEPSSHDRSSASDDSQKSKKQPICIDFAHLKEKYFCKYCGKSYNSVNRLNKEKCPRSPKGFHKPFLGEIQYRYFCKYCSRNYPTIANMCSCKCSQSPTEYHVPYAGEPKRFYQCKFCGKVENHMRDLCDRKCQKSPSHFHVPYAGESRREYCCKFCGSCFDFVYEMTDKKCQNSPYGFHIPYTGFRSRLYVCKYCDSEFRSIDEMTSKRCKTSPLDFHVPVTFFKKYYECKYCGESFRKCSELYEGECSKSPYGKHILFVGGNKRLYRCKFCGEGDKTIKELCISRCSKSPNGYHIPYSGEPKKTYICKYCGKRDGANSDLSSLHIGERNGSISELSSLYCSKSPCKKHVPFPTCEKEAYRCKYCGKIDETIRCLTDDKCNKSPNGYHIPHAGSFFSDKWMCKYCGKYEDNLKELCNSECRKSPNGFHIPHKTTYYT